MPIRPLLLCLIPVLLATTGCLELRQELDLDDDGTGEFTIDAALPASVYETWLAASDSPNLQRWADFFDATRGAERFNAAPGIDLNSYRVFEKNERLHVQIKGEITNLSQALDSGLLGNWTHTQAADGQETLSWQPPPGRLHAPATDLQQLAKGLYLSLTIKTPRNIVTSTATTSGRRRATWNFDSRESTDFLLKPPSISMTY